MTIAQIISFEGNDSSGNLFRVAHEPGKATIRRAGTVDSGAFLLTAG